MAGKPAAGKPAAGSLIVEADGGSRGNPGPAGYGAVVRDANSGEVLAERYESLGATTNNVAEYRGLIAGLETAADLAPGADVQVRMDSKLVVEQMSGRWQIKHPAMQPLASRASAAARRLGRVSYEWVPRAQNTHADRLANQAMDEAKNGGGGASPDSQGPRPAPRPGPGWTAAHSQPTTTVLLRHGETPLSAERRFAGRGDIPLTETGKLQAKAAAQRLAARGGVQLIVTSPLRRARLTAEAVAAATGAPVEVDEGWIEADFGEWEGLSYAEAMERWPDEVTAWMNDTSVAPPDGESFATAGRRVLAALDRLLERSDPGRVVVVSHVTPMKTVLRHALLAPPAALRRMHLDVACLCEVDWYADGPVVVRSLNDTGHLPPRE
ncbi:MAG TPA: bifunctional RNase H/acid phosphatase [Streptosporangiaceae bacterium]|nr:bifunctional RNase H/acid phosphatase [Streptosporangiaceae bacterium]